MTWNENWVWKNKLESIYCVSCGCFTYQKEDYNVSQDLIFLNSQNSHKTTDSNLAETLCQGQNPYPQPHTQPNCMQLPMTSLCWNPLIMANILNILNSVMKKEKEKSSEPGAQIFCENKEENKIEQLCEKLSFMCKDGCKFYRHYTYKLHILEHGFIKGK